MPEGPRVTFRMVTNRFRMVTARIDAGAEKAVQDFREKVADEARARVAVKTGETKDSIEATKDGVEAGGAALFLEMGTVKMAPQPFLAPAIEASRHTLEGEFAALFSGFKFI